MAKKSNYEVLRNQAPEDSFQYRDIRGDQDLKRKKREGPGSFTPYLVGTIILSILMALFIYLVLHLVGYGIGMLRGSLRGVNVEKNYETVYLSEEDGYGFTGYAYKWKSDGKIHKEKPSVEDTQAGERKGFSISEALSPRLIPSLLTLLISAGLSSLMYMKFKKLYEAQVAETDVKNDHVEDVWLQTVDEMLSKYDYFPDNGGHMSAQVSSVIAHIGCLNKGIKSVQLAKRLDKDVIGEDGEVEFYKGDYEFDEDGEIQFETLPLFDDEYREALFDASGVPRDKKLRKAFDLTKIPYNPDGTDRKKKKYKTVADLVNEDMELPYYEVARPGGLYLIDTEPVNTMVLAITRAGKGQTLIEPTIDMWTREKETNNIVINDPKGELLVKNYVPATVRGYTPVQFNLMNPMKTDIYNPLHLAYDMAREGNFTKMATYVENIANVFFPLDGGEDPVWPNAANNAFKRAVYGLIDFYMEEERQLRIKAQEQGMDDKTLSAKMDELWAHVSLYNAYQLFVQLTSKRRKNPLSVFNDKMKRGEFEEYTDDEIQEIFDRAQMQSMLWEDKPDVDLLTLYFNATKVLPRNTMRMRVDETDASLRSMGGAEKMLASVYGIAITAMSFFTDPTISTLTSGTPSMNADLATLSFPRRLAVRFHPDFLKKYNLVGVQAKWSAYEDENFEKPLGKGFVHENIVSREGWSNYYFKGKFPKKTAYVKMELLNPQTGLLIRSFYFKFTKLFRMSLDARRYVKDPVLGENIIHNGTLEEMTWHKGKDGEKRLAFGHTTFVQEKILHPEDSAVKESVHTRAITQTAIRYTEKPKIIFLVTPPHLTKYAKLILILIKQMVDLNFDGSYMTESDQKPHYKTRYMLDELGNLQSEGHGIADFQTMLSIGLGQDQQFTLILQTLQQLRDVYGDSVDKIVQGNCVSMDAPIATPDGFVKNRDLKVGDMVLTPFGGVTRVDGVFPNGVKPVYQVTLADGSCVEATGDHLWNIQRWKTAIAYTGKNPDGSRRYEGTGSDGKTAELVDEIITTDELKVRVEKGENISLPIISPAMYKTRDLPVHPYVMGVILGDGAINKNGSVFVSMGDAKAAHIVEKMKNLGYVVSHRKPYEGRVPSYGIYGLSAFMRSYGLAGTNALTKFIPDDYLYADVNQRIQLLRGLMDTDGTISKNSEMEYVSVSKDLAEDVQELIRSLGGRVDIHVKNDVYYTSPMQPEKKKANPAFRLQNIRLHGINPFTWEKKASRWSDDRMGSGSPGNYGNRVVSVVYSRDTEVQCIRVEDEPHMYLTKDYIPTHNTSNIIFLKSTDDSMIDTLVKMSGQTHETHQDSLTVTKDKERLLLPNEGKVSVTVSVQQTSVLKYNDFAFLPERNSIVFRAGDMPILNRNETIMPMSWRLFQKKIVHPGHNYNLQTLPTLSSAIEFDVRQNQPDFIAMLNKRLEYAYRAPDAIQLFKDAYGYDDYQMSKLDIDKTADDIMEIIDRLIQHEVDAIRMEQERQAEEEGIDEIGTYDESALWNMGNEYEDYVDEDVVRETQKAQTEYDEKYLHSYCDGMVTRGDLMPNGVIPHSQDGWLLDVFREVKGDMFADKQHFSEVQGQLYSSDGKPYIIKAQASESLRDAQTLVQSGSISVQGERVTAEDVAQIDGFIVTDEFYRFLVRCDKWDFARGRFEAAAIRRLKDGL